MVIDIATTAIWKIDNKLSRVIDYTSNAEKTKNMVDPDLYKSLHDVIEYAEADFKTEEQYLVTGLNCHPNNAYEEMKLTKEFFNKKDGILGFHAFQSFAEGEVTPDVAHEIGIKLAQELWGDRFEVIVSTHINTKHIHNHYVLNSVSFVDGKKYYDNRDTYAFMRHTSDELCREYGLSVLEEKKCKKSKINYDNYYKNYIQKNGYRKQAKDDVDFAIRQAYTYDDFKKVLSKMDYEVYERYGKVTIKKPNHQPIRLERAYGENYSKYIITQRILEEEAVRLPFIDSKLLRNNSYYIPTIRLNRKSHIKVTGFMAIYFHYYYLLHRNERNKTTKLTPEMRAEVRKMNMYSEEAKFLSRNKINTNEDLSIYKDTKNFEINELSTSRRALWYKRKVITEPNKRYEICKQIEDINNKLSILRKEVELCEDIEKRIPKMKEDLKNQKKLEDEQKKIKNYEKTNDNKFRYF